MECFLIIKSQQTACQSHHYNNRGCTIDAPLWNETTYFISTTGSYHNQSFVNIKRKGQMVDEPTCTAKI
jgi:hypothetical protein